MTDLFPDQEETLSPREKWKREHGVTTLKLTIPSPYGKDWEAASSMHDTVCNGDTADEALDNLAAHLAKRGIPGWEGTK